ncbi:tape measure protein [Stutzerimonas kunmingensis]|uniref:tape measure protein n=1 Tax=Stutzerimonas kunmingensis TaxID=1211807 RepID=UPI001F3BF24B|nr:tape measure protein [Stutzerimonas kunmingensis]UIP34457.1 tape measure protein [Stutzerimonas kunmingensis]
MARPVSSFYAQIGIQTRLQDLRRVDRYLKLLEGKVRKTTAALQKDFSKTLVLPTLKIKKVQIDNTLNAQRSIQTDLNRIGRLTELRIGSVKLDEARITRQIQNLFTRASSAARLNLRTIQGSSGGASLHYPTYAPRLPHMPNTQSLGQYAGAAGFGGGIGASLPMMGGPVGLAVAGVTAGGYMAYSKVSQLKQSQTDVEAQRVKLDVASGYKDRKDIDRQNEEFFSLANMTGSDAMSLVDSYSQMMKTLQAIGLSSEKSFDLYKNMSLFAKSTGADSQQMSRAGYAIGQIYGKGFVSREELQLQLADALPSFRRYLMDVYAKETGNSSFESFDKALTDKKITTQMLEQAFREAAKSGMPNVQQYANTAQGMENQYANQVLQEQMRRTLEEDGVVPAAKEFTTALGELHKATMPLRDSFYSLAASSTSTAAKLINIVSERLTVAPAMHGKASPEQMDTSVYSSAQGRGLLSVPSVERLKQSKPATGPILPIPVSKKEWQLAAEGYASPEALLEQMSTTNNISMQASMTISAGGIVVNTQATDAEQLAQELEPHIRQQFDNSLQGLLTETDIAFGSK